MLASQDDRNAKYATFQVVIADSTGAERRSSRRFLCITSDCDKATFAEQIPHLPIRHGRSTLLLPKIRECLSLNSPTTPSAAPVDPRHLEPVRIYDRDVPQTPALPEELDRLMRLPYRDLGSTRRENNGVGPDLARCCGASDSLG